MRPSGSPRTRRCCSRRPTGTTPTTPEPEIALVDEDAEESEDADEEVPAEDNGPVGDQDLLSDLGTDASSLVDLCTKEGMLPSEVLTFLAEKAGAADALESVR